MIHRTLNIAFVAALGLTLAACATTKEEPVEQPAEPQAAAPEPAPAAAPAPTNMISYEVQRGDHLWGIASQPRIYGNPYAWPLIYKSNSAKIKDADLIYPGQNFDINRDVASSDMDAAVRHARTRGEWSVGATEQSDKDYLAGRR
jgi:hypothetical protein